MHRTPNMPAVDKPLSLWGLLLGLPALASLAMLSTGQGGAGSAGTDDAGAGDANAGAGSASSVNTPATPPGLTQEQWNAAWARERAKEATAAEARMLKDLGVDSLDDAKAALTAKRSADEKDLSDAQKATKAAERAKAESEAETATARATTRRANVTLALAAAAVRHDRITQATTLLMAELSPDADEKAITDAIKAQTTAMPEFYAVPGGGGVDLGGRGPNGAKGGKDSYQAGLDLGKANRDAATSQTSQFLAGLPGWTGK